MVLNVFKFRYQVRYAEVWLFGKEMVTFMYQVRDGKFGYRVRDGYF